jgi:ABC-2 type transport system ATP-binding protein
MTFTATAWYRLSVTTPAILCHALTKEYQSSKKEPGFWGTVRSFTSPHTIKVKAVSDFNVEIQPGEIVGLLGPNGAGKTTIMKMLSGIVAPTGGIAQVLGFEPFKRAKEFRKRIALVMGQKTQLWWDIPAYDSFQLLQRYYEVSDRDFKERVETLGTLLGVTHLFTTHLRRLSLGERMKMELMACLLHKPDLCFLDEPTIGLDVVAQKQIRDFFKEYQRVHRTTIVLTSHYMADIDALCPRIVLVLGGRKRFDGPIREFERILGREKFVSLVFSEPVDQQHSLWQGLNPQWEPHGLAVELQIDESQLRDTSIKILSQFPVVDYSTEKMPIERVLKALMTNPKLLPE